MRPDPDLHPALRDLIDLLAQAAVDEFLADTDDTAGPQEPPSSASEKEARAGQGASGAQRVCT